MDKISQNESTQDNSKGVANQCFSTSPNLRSLPPPTLRFSAAGNISPAIQRTPIEVDGWWESDIEEIEGIYLSAKEVIVWELDEFKSNRNLIPEGYLERIRVYYEAEGGDEYDEQIRNLIWEVFQVQVGGEEEQEVAVPEEHDELEADEAADEAAEEELDDGLAFFLRKVLSLNDENVKEYQINGLKKIWEKGDQAQRDRMTGIFSDNEELASLSSLEYILEAINPLHVGYERGRKLFDDWNAWTESPFYATSQFGEESFAQYVERKAPDLRGEQGYVEVDSYTAAERVQYEVQFEGKNLKKADGGALVGDNIYVLSPEGTFYSKEKEGSMHHSSFLQGAPVICAGHFFTDGSGKLTKIDNSSGHYGPSNQQLKRALIILQGKMDTSEVMVGIHRGANVSIETFLATT